MNRKLELIIASLAVASVGVAIILDVFPLSESQSNLIYAFDWNNFFDSDSKGKNVEIITRKVLDFVAPGAHAGNSILEMNHAYFAILQAFSLTHLVISRFKTIVDCPFSFRTLEVGFLG
jgi:hypothetical protein